MTSFLVRKVARAKWESNPKLGLSKISADAVTADLRTEGNELSLWKAASPAESEIERVALALAAGMQKLDVLDIAWFSTNEVTSIGVELRDSPEHAVTAAESLKYLHLDAVNLDVILLEQIARSVASAVRNHGHCRRFSRKEIRKILWTGITNGIVTVDKLSSDLRSEFEHAPPPA